MLAKDLMTTPAISVTCDTSIRRVVQLMLEKNVSGLPVIDGKGVLCGMITESDLLRKAIFSGGSRTPPTQKDEAFFEEYVRAHGSVVADCMSRDIVSIPPTATLSTLAARMRERNIRRLPVIDKEELVGVVSRHDVLRAITSARDIVADGDDALRLAVATRLYEELGLRNSDVAVHVSSSVVELVAPGEDPAKRRAIELVAESVAGVAGVVLRSPTGSEGPSAKH